MVQELHLAYSTATSPWIRATHCGSHDIISLCAELVGVWKLQPGPETSECLTCLTAVCVKCSFIGLVSERSRLLQWVCDAAAGGHVGDGMGWIKCPRVLQIHCDVTCDHVWLWSPLTVGHRHPEVLLFSAFCCHRRSHFQVFLSRLLCVASWLMEEYGFYIITWECVSSATLCGISAFMPFLFDCFGGNFLFSYFLCVFFFFCFWVFCLFRVSDKFSSVIVWVL